MRNGALLLIVLMFAGCAIKRAPDPVSQPVPQPQPQPQVESPAPEPPDPMAEVPGDRPLPLARGAVERYDCKVGPENEHARIAVEAHGGQVTGFAYYSKWKPRTCSIDVDYTNAMLKWRQTPDGAIRVHASDGVFVIRTRPDAYVFEFQNVQRQRYCGMMGVINGSMTVVRYAPQPQCSVIGVLDR